MWGWDSRARAWASLSNRATNSALWAYCSRRTLMAIGRPSARRRPRYTSAIPPSLRGARTSYFPSSTRPITASGLQGHPLLPPPLPVFPRGGGPLSPQRAGGHCVPWPSGTGEQAPEAREGVLRALRRDPLAHAAPVRGRDVVGGERRAPDDRVEGHAEGPGGNAPQDRHPAAAHAQEVRVLEPVGEASCGEEEGHGHGRRHARRRILPAGPDPHEHRRGVVEAAAGVGEAHEEAARLLVVAGPAEGREDLPRSDRRVDPVAHQQEAVAAPQGDGKEVAGGLVADAESARQHVTLGVRAGVGGIHRPALLELGHEGVVGGQLPDLASADHVGPRVAHVADDRFAARHEDRRAGRRHGEGTLASGPAADGPVGPLEGAGEASRGGRPSARRPGTSSRSVATARSLATYPCGCPPSPSATAYKDAPGPARSRRSTRSSLVPRTRPASLTAVPCATNPLIPGPPGPPGRSSPARPAGTARGLLPACRAVTPHRGPPAPRSLRAPGPRGGGRRRQAREDARSPASRSCCRGRAPPPRPPCAPARDASGSRWGRAGRYPGPPAAPPSRPAWRASTRGPRAPSGPPRPEGGDGRRPGPQACRPWCQVPPAHAPSPGETAVPARRPRGRATGSVTSRPPGAPAPRPGSSATAAPRLRPAGAGRRPPGSPSPARSGR